MVNIGEIQDGYEYMGGPLYEPTSWRAVDQKGGVKPGDVQDGYQFMGGAPSDPRNWRQVEETWGEYLTGAARSGLQGLSFGFGDELVAAAAAAGGEAPYDEALAAERQALRTFEQRHPYVAFGSELAGSLPAALIPGAGAARAATLGERLASSAKVGAAYGGLYGAGASEGGVGERLYGAARGAAAGAVLGPVATEIAAPAVGKLAEALAGRGAGRAQTVQNAADRLADIEAFKRMGIEPFGPALADKGVATAARGVEQLPIVGRIVKEPKAGVEAQLGTAQERLASALGAAASDEEAGLIAQRALDRYRTARLQELEPGVVSGLGVAASTPVRGAKPGQITITGATPQYVSKFSTRGLTDEQLAAAAKTGQGGGVSFAGGVRRRIEDLSDAELQRIIQTPAHKTSFATRQEALYEDAYRSFPKRFKVSGAANPEEVATPHSALVAQGMKTQEQAARISAGVLEGRFGPLVTDLINGRSNFTIPALRAARTEIGRALSNFGTYDARLDRGQLKQLYGALSQDIEQALVSVAARARQGSRLAPRINGKKNPAYVNPAAADRADSALSKLRLADRYTRASMDRMERFMGLLNANTLDEAGRKIGRFVRESTSNIGALRTLKSSLRPEEWNPIAGHVVASLGQGRAGAAEAEAGFNIATWATDWNRLSPQAKDVLFGTGTSALRRSLNDFSRVVERMKYYETTRNYSGTANTLLSIGAAQGAIHAIFNPSLMLQGLATMGGTAAMAKLWTSPAYVRWLSRAYQMEARGSTRTQWQAHLKTLSEISSVEPDLGYMMMNAAIIGMQPQPAAR